MFQEYDFGFLSSLFKVVQKWIWNKNYFWFLPFPHIWHWLFKLTLTDNCRALTCTDIFGWYHELPCTMFSLKLLGGVSSKVLISAGWYMNTLGGSVLILADCYMEEADSQVPVTVDLYLVAGPSSNQEQLPAWPILGTKISMFYWFQYQDYCFLPWISVLYHDRTVNTGRHVDRRPVKSLSRDHDFPVW